MKKILIVLFILTIVQSVQAQDYIGPSPNATAMMRQANIGVSHYTGTPNISIPLAELSGRELGVSASLLYNSSGHRVQDIASSEGLGWSLSVGGMITRVVRGEPDEATNGFCQSNPTDTEPDLFIFSFMGRSGKFVLNGSGTPILFPFQDLKIIPGICGSGESWEIIDENGTRYQFGSSVASREKTSHKLVVGSGPTKDYISTWHLNKVTTLNGTDEMTFFYTSSTVKYESYFYSKNEDWCTDNGEKNESLDITVGQRYLLSITSSGGYMYFSWNNYREDVTGAKSLSEIKVVNRENQQIKKFRFEYSYFNPGHSNPLYKRLKLDKIYDQSPAPLFSFEYIINRSLPARNSKAYDYLGYYNNNSATSWFVAVPNAGLTGASREPDGLSTQAFVLNQINERGGGQKFFNYEGNEAKVGSQNKSVPGLRIKDITLKDGEGNEMKTEYKYFENSSSTVSSGIQFRKPLLYIPYPNDLNQVVKRFSHSYVELMDVNGVNVGYSRVEEIREGKGKVIYNFSNYNTRPDEGTNGDPSTDILFFTSVTSHFWERGNPLNIEIQDNNQIIIKREIFDYNYDHPQKGEVSAQKVIPLNCPDGNFAPVDFFYKIISKPFTLQKKTTELYDQEDTNNLRKISQIEEYTYDTSLYQLVGSTGWNTAEPTEKYETVNKYITHQDYNYSQIQSCVDSYNQCLQNCGEMIGTCADNCYDTYSTCLDQSVTDVRTKTILSLKAKHAHNTLVEQQQWINRNGTRTFLGASLDLFKFAGTNNDLIVPASLWSSQKVTGSYTSSNINSSGQFIKPSSFLLSTSFDNYDNDYGKVLQNTKRDGIVNQYTWLHNHTLIGSITMNPGNDQLAKSYLHKPLVGVIKETDTNNKSLSNEYDYQGRLRLVKDNDGNIMERYRYHYQNETPGVRIKANKEDALINQSISFSLEDIVSPSGGTPEYAWDMDNGTVYDDSRMTTSVAYGSQGSYEVKTVMFTNEFEPFTAKKRVYVWTPLNYSLCIDGPQWVDLCYQDPVIFGSCTQQNNQPTSPIEIKVNFSSQGCPNVNTFLWEYKKPSSSTWIVINSLGTSAFLPHQAFETGNYDIRCTFTDGCNTTVTKSTYVNFYKSNQFCN